jgi:hypothetical protein
LPVYGSGKFAITRPNGILLDWLLRLLLISKSADNFGNNTIEDVISKGAT